MIYKAAVGNIYQINIPVLPSEQSRILYFQVKPENERDETGRLMMQYNLDDTKQVLTNEILLMACPIALSRILLFYMGFHYIAEPLPGIQTEHHFVHYNSVDGHDIAITLVESNDGRYQILRFEEERLQYIVGGILSSLDELQDYMLVHYRIKFRPALGTVSHACLYKEAIERSALSVAASIVQRGCVVKNSIISIVAYEFQLSIESISTQDLDVVIEYGLSMNMYKRDLSTGVECFVQA